MNRLACLVRTLYRSSFVRFAAVGGIATAINYATYVLIVSRCEALDLTADYIPTLAYIGAFAVSIICNFILSNYFTFGTKPTWARAGKFLTAHLVNLFNELVLLNLWLWIGVGKLYAPLCVFAVAFPLNYFMVRFALRGRTGKGDAC